MDRMPSLFVSHGSPMLAIEAVAANDFLRGLGAGIGKPTAVLIVSAHWEAHAPTVSAAPRPETIHDFSGFPPALYEIVYPAPGAPNLADRVVALLSAAGIESAVDPGRGLDHGAWVPLRLMFPDADIPVAQLSVQPRGGPAHHLRLGEVLKPLRDEGVLIVGSGSLTHNLYELRRTDTEAPVPEWVSQFGDWVAAAVADGRNEDLLGYRALAPHAADNHPSEEHLLPLFVALGAGDDRTAGRRLHTSHTYGVLAMDAYDFGAE